MSNHTRESAPTLVLLCKRPALHQGKQRLAATLGAVPALTLAELFLGCALEDAAHWPGEVVISPARPADRQWAAELLPGCRVKVQSGGNLGQRLNALDAGLRAAGHRRLLFIGSDAPALTADHYRQARRALGRHDIVLSPAADGGVTMMGGATPWPALAGLPWSRSTLGGALAAQCQRQGLDVHRIRPGYDIDRQGDLLRLVRDLGSDCRPARQQLYRGLQALLPELFAVAQGVPR